MKRLNFLTAMLLTGMNTAAMAHSLGGGEDSLHSHMDAQLQDWVPYGDYLVVFGIVIGVVVLVLKVASVAAWLARKGLSRLKPADRQ